MGDFSISNAENPRIKSEIEVADTEFQEQIWNGAGQQILDGSNLHSIALSEIESAKKHIDSVEHIPSTLPFRCSICPKRYATNIVLQKHVRKRHDSKNLPAICQICSKRFNYRSILNAHMITHSEKVCPVCSNVFVNNEALKKHVECLHMNAPNSTRPYKCNKCDAAFEKPSSLNEHAKIHETQNFRCSQCHEHFICRSLLKSHINKVHIDRDMHTCDKCPRTFRNRQTLQKHIAKHLNNKNRFKYACGRCKKFCKSKAMLDIHMNFHLGERSFKCEECPMAFFSLDVLKVHASRHSDGRKFECRICDKKFSRDIARRSHEKTHANTNKAFYCEKCNMYFTRTQVDGHYKGKKCSGGLLKCQENGANDASKESTQSEKYEDIQTDDLPVKNGRTDDETQRMRFITPDQIQEKYKCGECDKEFICKRILNFHSRSHVKDAP